jgi:hypothetical protein
VVARGGRDRPVDLVDVRVGRVTGDRGQRQQVVGSPRGQRHQPDHAQPVLGQRAGLVEADGVDPTERLQHPRVAHHGPAPRQPARSGLLRDGRDQRQPLGDRGDGDGDARLDGLLQRAAPQQRQPDDGPSAGQGERQHRPGQLAQPRLHARRGRGDTRGGARPDPPQ